MILGSMSEGRGWGEKEKRFEPLQTFVSMRIHVRT